ncbi:MAG: lipopolysaccharide heptosyltransferase II [Gallionella sp.]|nr:lipopolysaccharide heptosyltransferase II [Gallionella sp.]OIO11913.1 MAG: lipopolysaccharide heptosyltransferase II [Gallionellaceae bacterium CG1_02_60_325]PIR09816.1 MAG: lipopolysaccharide heptosyltransferase II [Gallionellaceae bacterium CG11_big_fil_rev_8_21_14_0_20_60_62]PIV47559.1 MAG: lipopolysaccharide heptosyltransferase II [Gallionellaceae bacterium CG02_land_8_20_14_3_00_60_115]PIY06189.1 MAG: lipopolysaccharide heptosyltransferase II [Gallionellaceae bacterium CG_4_10_14_3_um_f
MKKILVVTPSWVGDCVLMQPMLERLHQRHPGAQIDVFAPPWTEKLLRLMPQVHTIIPNPFAHGSLALGARRKLGAQLRAGGYDQTIVLPNSWKSALLPYFANIPLRTGFISEARFGLLNDARRLSRTKLPLMVERFAALAEAKGTEVARPVPAPRLQISAEEQAAALAKFKLSHDRPIAVFCPGAEYGPAKRWPAHYYAELAQQLLGRGYQVWLIGSPKDRELGEKIVALGNRRARNLCGDTDLAEAIALLAGADLVVSNDSGLMHIAAALNRPLLAIFGSSSPQFTPPLSARAQVLKLDLPCSPCFKRECPLGHFDCMLKLTPQTVAQHIPPPGDR